MCIFVAEEQMNPIQYMYILLIWLLIIWFVILFIGIWRRK